MNHPNMYFMQSHDQPVMKQAVYSVVVSCKCGEVYLWEIGCCNEIRY